VDDVRVIQAETIEHAYRTNRDRLWKALLAYTGDPEIASDALAETVARALASRTSIDDAAAWLWRVGFRVATAELKAARKPDPEREPSYELDEEVLDVLIALNRLTSRQRATFVLFYLDDRPTEEIAIVLGLSAATVSVHLHRARRRLRSILEADDA
jgi:RNA polymerase sigma-70 factor (ECF subfamily)